ncbi:MAG: hypothetical protein IPP58_15085 [Holophagaceae bacterium]|uniref:Thiolase N-terminal domain-containing protein n=1 Tax=Candidatus Geothrix skivensis TaxID=2954439 RepID=A0A9D7XMT6_9BACT|nr:hypothetical protein [Candidatus Geothrix skivensis]
MGDGNVLQAGGSQNVARLAALKAGPPLRLRPTHPNRVRLRLEGVAALGAQSILLGDADLVVAGVPESMSTRLPAPPAARWGARMGKPSRGQHDPGWPLCGPLPGDTQVGITAENIAARHGLSREVQDTLALQSQLMPPPPRLSPWPSTGRSSRSPWPPRRAMASQPGRASRSTPRPRASG